MKRGIDVSYHNGPINWKKVKGDGVEFAILRAGYGHNHVDERFENNVRGCAENDIDFGVYWFSYAGSTTEATEEAKTCLFHVKQMAHKYANNPVLPIFFDFEYDSDRYLKNQGRPITSAQRCKIAEAFLQEIAANGYKAGIYTNVDYLSKGFKTLVGRYDLWLAQWNDKGPSYECAIWQQSDMGVIDGISGAVDINYLYANYQQTSNKTETAFKLKELTDNIAEKYIGYAKECIMGKWGNGIDRKKAMEERNIDYNFVQSIINVLLN